MTRRKPLRRALMRPGAPAAYSADPESIRFSTEQTQSILRALGMKRGRVPEGQVAHILSDVAEVLADYRGIEKTVDQAPRAANLMAEITPIWRHASALAGALERDLSEHAWLLLHIAMRRGGANADKASDAVGAIATAAEKLISDLSPFESRQAVPTYALASTTTALCRVFNRYSTYPPATRRRELRDALLQFVDAALDAIGVRAPSDMSRYLPKAE